MMPEDDPPTNREENGSRGFRFDPSLLSVLGVDVDAALAAGDRLAASANADAVPLPVVRLAESTGDDGRF
jgi:hypothetical protein